ncbi:hypothetical protein HKBW3S42_00831, partial [Candidatus Hakubella thermalkaliphila]
MSTFLELNNDLGLQYADLGHRLNKIPKNVTGGRCLITVSDLRSKEPIETAGHQGQLQITVDLHRNSRGKGIHVKEVDPISNTVFDDHALGIAFNQLRRRAMPLIGNQDSRLFMSQSFNNHLPQSSRIAWKLNGLIQNLGGLVETRDPLEFNPPPSGDWLLMNLMDHFLSPSPNRDKINSHLVELVEISI